MQKQERLDPGWAWTKKYNIGAGVKVGDTIYASGLVALDSEGNVIGEDVTPNLVRFSKILRVC